MIMLHVEIIGMVYKSKDLAEGWVGANDNDGGFVVRFEWREVKLKLIFVVKRVKL